MGWSDLPISEGYDWARPAFLNQFIDAINERAVALLGSYPGPTRSWPASFRWSAGKMVSKATRINTFLQETVGWRDLQQGVVALGISFYNHVDYPTGHHGLAEAPRFSQSRLFTAAGLNAGGFTRKFPDGLGGVTTSYGYLQAGDYIGSWIFNELHAVLNVMKSTIARLNAVGASARVRWWPGSTKWFAAYASVAGTGVYPTDWLPLRADVDATVLGGTSSPYSGTNVPPHAVTVDAVATPGVNDLVMSLRSAVTSKILWELSLSGIPVVRVDAYAMIDNGSWPAGGIQGYGIDQEDLSGAPGGSNVWLLVESKNLPGTSWTTGEWGNVNAFPGWPVAMPAPIGSEDQARRRGWRAMQAQAVQEWQFEYR